MILPDSKRPRIRPFNKPLYLNFPMRPVFLRILVMLLTFGGVLSSISSAAAEQARPNIIWLMAEDMGLDLECYGMAGVQTPNLNRLAQEGALFTRAYASNPICSPNRSAMMVGVNQNVINAQHHRSNRDVPLMAPYKPITYWLREAGYTALLGHSTVLEKGTKIDCNFKTQTTGPYDGVTQFGIFHAREDFSAAQQPFFSQIQLKVTHRGDWWKGVREASADPVKLADVELPPFFADTPEIRYDWATYLDTVEYMDAEVGVLMDDLKAQGLADNTIIIFIADNGRCNLRGKGYLHESGVHVPMIVWAPGLIEAGTVVEELVTTTDISRTVLELAGAHQPDYLTGQSFLRVAESPNHEYVRTARDIWDEIDECSRGITTKEFSYIRNYMPEVPWATDQAYLEINRPALHVMRRLKEQRELTHAGMTFFADRKPVEELYDLRNDPDQMVNLADDSRYRDALHDMRNRERQWQAENRDFGLMDLGRRSPDQGMGAQLVREGVKQQAPELWERLESGELMATQAWKKYILKTSKSK